MTTPPRLAAVLVPLFRDIAGELRTVLILRSAHGVHGSQLAFPGGKPEAEDESLFHTALREAEEEAGIDASQAELLAQLEPLETLTTGFRVYPFLARVPAETAWRAHPVEVAAVLTPSLAVLRDPRRRTRRRMEFAGWAQPREVPAVAVTEKLFLWGLTLRIVDLLPPELLSERM